MSSEAQSTVEKGEATYIFASPEMLQERRWRDLFLQDHYQKNLRAVFIDEAHCVEAWGGGKHPFRKSYSLLRDLRSFFHPGVPFCALTATATTTTRRYIVDSLGMQNALVVSSSPNRNNIKYHIIQIGDIEQSFQWIVDDLKEHREHADKRVIYCKSIESCAMLYRFFLMSLQDEGYIGSDRHISKCLFAMFHAKITDQQKAAILESFSKPDGICRVMFATIAFGMGVNIPDIHMVIHYGPSRNIEDYVQECGRAGRDGNSCHAVLCLFTGCTRGDISDGMKQYCHLSEVSCRRVALFTNFPGEFTCPVPKHRCCDVCAVECDCECVCEVKNLPACEQCCQCEVRCSSILCNGLKELFQKQLLVSNHETESDLDDSLDAPLLWDQENSFSCASQ